MKLSTKTIIALSSSFVITILVFTIAIDAYFWIYDPNWNGLKPFSNSNEKNNNEMIVILGNSQVQAVNATYVSNFLSDNNKNYDIYNLADPGAQPK